MIDRNELDTYITGHYGEDQELGEDEAEHDPSECSNMRALMSASFDIMHRLHEEDWSARETARAFLENQLASFGRIQGELNELRDIKKALAVLKGVL